jgi:methionyl-tRNA synthetase
MSKSVGNIVDPFVLADKYGADALRYYLMSDIATGQDADFSEERLVERYNTDLANTLGNLLNRTLNMAHRYRVGKLRGFKFTSSSSLSVLATVDTLKTRVITATQMVQDAMDNDQIHNLGYDVTELATLCNSSIEDTAPWRLAKEPDEDTRDQLDAVLYTLAESLRIIAILISPALPRAAHGIFDQLNWKMELSGKEERFSLADTEWGKLPDGHVVGKPVPLFPRIETP